MMTQQIESSGLDQEAIELVDKSAVRGTEEATPNVESMNGGGDSQSVILHGWKLTLVIFALCLAVFCMALDNTIIATAIPRISDQFHALEDVGWYGSAYLLTTCSFQLIFGKIYTFYSVKWVFIIVIGFFELGSLVCGAAPNSTSLIIGRAISGVGAAGIFSGAILIIAQSVPIRHRPAYNGLMSAMYGLASVAGPLMGGAFTDRLSWRFCFYINLPFGAVTIVFIVLFFKSPTKAENLNWRAQIAQLDLEGGLCSLTGIIALLLALQWGGSTYPWPSSRIIGLFVVFGVLASVFVAIQIWKQDKATVPPRIVSNSGVLGCATFAFCFGGSFFLLIYYLPIWFQAIKGASAVRSGIMNLPMILASVTVSVLAGVAISVLGHYTPLLYVASILMSIGAGLLTTFTIDTAAPKWIGYQVLYGIGTGLGMQLQLIAMQNALPEPDIPIGLAILIFSQTLGGTISVQLAKNVFTNQLIKHLASEPQIDSRAVLAGGATELRSEIPAELLHPVLIACNAALTETWYVALSLAALSLLPALFVEWKSTKGRRTKPSS